jgi:Uma2 family endonuclease
MSALFSHPGEFLAWEIRQERKHELVGGVVRRLPDANRARLEIRGNLASALNARLHRRTCQALASMKTVIPNKNYRYADIAVDCGPQNPRDLVATGPRVAFEVESPSNTVSETLDRLADYQTVETMDHVVLLARTRAFARVWTKRFAGLGERGCGGAGRDA